MIHALNWNFRLLEHPKKGKFSHHQPIGVWEGKKEERIENKNLCKIMIMILRISISLCYFDVFSRLHCKQCICFYFYHKYLVSTFHSNFTSFPLYFCNSLHAEFTLVPSFPSVSSFIFFEYQISFCSIWGIFFSFSLFRVQCERKEKKNSLHRKCRKGNYHR